MTLSMRYRVLFWVSFMLSVIDAVCGKMPSTLNVIKLNVIMPSVVAPKFVHLFSGALYNK